MALRYEIIQNRMGDYDIYTDDNLIETVKTKQEALQVLEKIINPRKRVIQKDRYSLIFDNFN